MTTKSKFASFANGGLTGAGQGGVLGGAIGGAPGAIIGGGAGLILGGIGGLLSDSANEEAQQNDPEYQAAKRREKTMRLMSASLGRAFGGLQKPSFGSFTDSFLGR